MENSELVQQKNLLAIQRLGIGILKRHLGFLAFVFLGFAVLMAGMFFKSGLLSPYRCEAQTVLVFYPKGTKKIDAVEANQLLRILSMRDLKAKVASSLNLTVAETAELQNGIEIWQNRQQKDSFSVKAYARTENEALERVNAFADVAVKEYITFRLNDLADWRATNDQRHAEILQELNKLDDDIIGMGFPIGPSTIEYEERRIKAELAMMNSRYLEVRLKYANEQNRMKHLEAELQQVDPAIINETDEIHRFTTKLEKLDDNIEALRRLYTEENPILIIAVEEREALAKRYREFLKRFGVSHINENTIAHFNQLGRQAKETQLTLESLAIAVQVAEEEVKRSQKSLEELMRSSRDVDMLRAKRDALRTNLQSLEEKENDIRYLETAARHELMVLEHVTHASSRPALALTKVLLSLIFAVFLTFVTAFLLAVMAILFGKIHDGGELECYWAASSLGEFSPNDSLGFDELFYRFQDQLSNRQVVFIGLLPGAEQNDKLLADFVLRSTMAGMRTLVLHIKDAKTFEPPENAVEYTAVCHKDGIGYFAVANMEHLTASELEMLKADLAILKSEFDRIFLTTQEKVRGGKVLLNEMLTVCDAVLLVVGKERTPRATLRKAIAEHKDESKPIMTLMSSCRLLALLLALSALVFTSGCYPDRLTGNYEQYPDLESPDNAIVEESELSSEQKEQNYKELMEYETEEEAPYRINAGDKIAVTFYNHQELNMTTIITPDGYIGVMFIGQVKVAGMTLGEASRLIEEKLKKYIKYPAVGLSLLEISSETVTIVGAVGKPGMYTISHGMRLADLYALAGGSSVRRFHDQDLDAADLMNSTFLRGDKILPVDFFAAIEQGTRPNNIKLRKGDYVFIAAREEATVCLVGNVRVPQRHIWNKNMGIIELLTDGGWMAETYWSNVIIIRGGVANPHLYKVDIDSILAGKRADVRLLPGDIVFVPHDNLSEYNVFVRKLLPTSQLINLLMSPFHEYKALK